MNTGFDFRMAYEFWYYVRVLLFIVAIVFAARWRSQKGKALLCSFLSAKLLAIFLSLLMFHRIVNMPIRLFCLAVDIAANVLLLLFVIEFVKQKNREYGSSPYPYSPQQEGGLKEGPMSSCPKCGEEIADGATVCKHCHAEI